MFSPDVSNATAYGVSNAADVAALSSPLKPAAPVPAMVYINPVDKVIFRTRLLLLSAMYTLPMKKNEH